MKVKLIASCLLLASAVGLAQVQVSNGPNLANDKNSKMNRMLGGDDNSFYCYRVRSKGKGTSYIIEKYDKVTLKPVFSKEVPVDASAKTKVEDVEYCKGNVFFFSRRYDKTNDKMTLFYQVVSSGGSVDQQVRELVTVSSDHYEFVDFDVYPNPSQTKFLIKVAHKANKEDKYKTDLILLDGGSMKKLWTKTVNQRLSSDIDNLWAAIFSSFVKKNPFEFTGIFLDNDDNLCYAYTEKANPDDKKSGYLFKMALLNAKDNTPTIIDLPFDDKYYVKDVQFMKTNNNEIVLGGFMKDVIERTGRDDVKIGIFNFTVNVKTKSVSSKSFKFFDTPFMTALEAANKKGKQKDLHYKMDYIIPIGKDVYYVGEQYNRYTTGNSMGSMGSSSSTTYVLEFMDVIVAKLNSKGEFEWVKNAPLRMKIASKQSPPPMYKQYFAYASNNNLYIMCDENKANIKTFEKPGFVPKMFKDAGKIHGSNFMCQSFSLSSGAFKRSLIFNNKDYCFAPIQEKNPQFRPPLDCEIFVPSKNNELFIYTENKGLDRFSKLKLE